MFNVDEFHKNFYFFFSDFQDQWSAEEMQILERFFDLKVLMVPLFYFLISIFSN